ncbi:hypothetical protein [Lachnoclostridium phytofermentans]|uniref:Uncharacterized protein n=1 Tax=Lachnoclostridium phytofermentans (strain ATCC 700394 / DSM 18823 / ISDg) TaxID=357809 RepID=A9KHS3_LACP7|nr:hypothetical protein [Lachnoclostridium phytofermentans]ABX42358.1 hypothetical protein Cphy_1990 [Lachnoclostridium phytofermentans ISDg]
MDLMKMYEQVQQRVNQINFQYLWRGFREYEFALYDDTIVILNGVSIPKTDEFLANTSIFYQGRYIAIWYITVDIDVDILTSKIIHEMFHAYQNQMQDCRFVNEFEALCNYQYSPLYLQLKHNENLLLADMVSDFSIEKLNNFLTYRKIRQIEFSYQYNYENSIEAIEGSAQYVEMQVLKTLSARKYLEFLKGIIDRVCSINNLIPVRIISYDIGALFLSVCFQNNLPLALEIGNTSEIFYSKLITQAHYKKLDIAIEPEIINFYNGYTKMLRGKIDNIITNSSEVIKGNFELLGFNVYSARFIDGYAYSEYFLMYKDNQPITLYGNYLFKLENDRVTEIYKEL